MAAEGRVKLLATIRHVRIADRRVLAQEMAGSTWPDHFPGLKSLRTASAMTEPLHYCALWPLVALHTGSVPFAASQARELRPVCFEELTSFWHACRVVSSGACVAKESASSTMSAKPEMKSSVKTLPISSCLRIIAFL